VNAVNERLASSAIQGIQAILAILAASWCTHALSVPQLDQENYVPTDTWLSVANDRTQVQTFTVGTAGSLTEVQVNVAKGAITSADLEVSLWTTDSRGLPLVNLASASFDVGSIPQDGSFLSWKFDGPNLLVIPGDLLAIALDSRAPNDYPFDARYDWAFGGSYNGGIAYTQQSGLYFAGSRDFQFRTIVEVPEPGSAVLMLFGCAVLLSRLRWRATS
jgi:hypothetical protein